MSRGPDFRALIAQHGSPLLLLDCAVVRRQYQSLQAALPGVGLFYALKPLPHPAVVAELRETPVLTISDVDSPASVVAQAGTAGSYGTFTMDAAGVWSYTASSAHDAFAGDRKSVE